MKWRKIEEDMWESEDNQAIVYRSGYYAGLPWWSLDISGFDRELSFALAFNAKKAYEIYVTTGRLVNDDTQSL